MKPILARYGMGAALLLALVGALSGAGWLHDRAVADEAVRAQQLRALTALTVSLTHAKGQAETVYVQTVEHFHTTHDSTVRELVARPGDSVSKGDAVASVERVTRACSLVIAACERRAQLADSLTAVWQQRAALLASGPHPSPPRLGLYGTVLYDPIAKAGSGRLSADLHVAGPFSLTGELEAQERALGRLDGGLRVGVRLHVR